MSRMLWSLAMVGGLWGSSTVQAAKLEDERPPLIQVAILLDTSGSMSGLIDQARSQLWKIVNEFALCKRNGKRPELQVALYEYGKPSLPVAEGYTRQIVPFTTDLDRVSEELFALRTNGGDEYCGVVIDRATRELKWSASNTDLKAMFIAGNEPFTQGNLDYRQACRAAIAKGIVVNTIHCGPESVGAQTGWRDGALLADGSFTNIDQNRALAAVVAPQDQEIARLGVLMNSTYIVFGAQGKAGQMRQAAQDSNAASANAKDSLTQRALFKSTANYNCDSWDLVDACRTGKLKLAELKEEQIPEEMKKMNAAQRQEYVDGKLKQRAEFQKQIARLNVEREQYVTLERKKASAKNGEKSLDDAVVETLRRQAAKKDFVFEKP